MKLFRLFLWLPTVCALHADPRQLFDREYPEGMQGPLGIVNDSVFIILGQPADSSRLFSIARIDRAGNVLSRTDVPVLHSHSQYSRYGTWGLSIRDACGRLLITGHQVSYFQQTAPSHEFHYDPLVIALDASGNVAMHKVLQSHLHKMSHSFACDESRWALLSNYPDYDSSYLFEADWQGDDVLQKNLKNHFRGRDEIQIRGDGYTLAGFRSGGAHAAADSLIAIETDGNLAAQATRKFLIPRPAIDFVTGATESFKYYLNGPGYYSVLYAIPNRTYSQEDTISLLAYRYDVAAGRLDTIPMGSYPMDNPWGDLRMDRSGFSLSLRHPSENPSDTSAPKSQLLLAFDHRMNPLLRDAFDYRGAINMLGTGLRDDYYVLVDNLAADRRRLRLYRFAYDAPVSLRPHRAVRVPETRRSDARDVLGRKAAGRKAAFRIEADRRR